VRISTTVYFIKGLNTNTLICYMTLVFIIKVDNGLAVNLDLDSSLSGIIMRQHHLQLSRFLVHKPKWRLNDKVLDRNWRRSVDIPEFCALKGCMSSDETHLQESGSREDFDSRSRGHGGRERPLAPAYLRRVSHWRRSEVLLQVDGTDGVLGQGG
jgi:hypothetical protein